MFHALLPTPLNRPQPPPTAPNRPQVGEDEGYAAELMVEFMYTGRLPQVGGFFYCDTFLCQNDVIQGSGRRVVARGGAAARVLCD
jgi:hypothetical protein